jgi:hypothetical protein
LILFSVRFEFLDASSQWLIGLVFLTLVLAASEAGFRFGCARQPTTTEVTKSQISYLETGILGVLGLLLGFTLAMAVSRFEARKQLVVDESNAIGTCFLRTQLLPAARGKAMSNLLREYVDARLRYSATSTRLDEGQKAARLRAVHLQDELWSRAVVFAQEDPRSVTAGLLLQSLNTVIDLESARFAASMNHVPETVILVVGFTAVLSAVLVGYLFGLGDQRNVLSTLTMAAALTAVLIVIVDLDRPDRGLIQISQRPLIEVLDRLRAQAAPATDNQKPAQQDLPSTHIAPRTP